MWFQDSVKDRRKHAPPPPTRPSSSPAELCHLQCGFCPAQDKSPGSLRMKKWPFINKCGTQSFRMLRDFKPLSCHPKFLHRALLSLFDLVRSLWRNLRHAPQDPPERKKEVKAFAYRSKQSR